MFSFISGPRYRLLRTDSPGKTTPSEDHPSLPEEDSEKARGSEQPATLQLSLWPLIVCLLCTLLNIVLYHLPVPITPASITGQDIWRLRRPSQYIRLDEIARPSPPVSRRFDNYPIVVVQVDSAHQDRVIDGHAPRYMVNSGNILPLEKHVYVSKTVSTIVQFRAIDYGMEACELKLTMNPDTVTWTSSSPFELEVFRLNATIPLDRKTSNYKTRPPRLAKVASIRVDPRLNTTWHRNFGCASDEVLTFEVACQPGIEDAGCHLEWWQTNQHPTSAVLVTQHATV